MVALLRPERITFHENRPTMLRTYSLSLLGALLLLGPAFLQAQNDYYAVYSPDQDSALLATVNVVTGVETNALPVTLNGTLMQGCTGMALDPVTGNVYVVAKNGSTFTLAIIDLNTGVLSSPVTLPDKFAGITFDNAGTLYGVTGDGASTPETVYVIDRNNGTTNLLAQPGTGSDGEAIAYNSNNGLLYRYGGGQVFQSIDPSNGTVTDVFISGGTPADFAHALVFNGSSFFFAAGFTLYQLSQNGTLVNISTILGSPVGYKGLVSVDAVPVAERERHAAPTIFPNPANDRITLAVDQGRMERVRVHDATGVGPAVGGPGPHRPGHLRPEARHVHPGGAGWSGAAHHVLQRAALGTAHTPGPEGGVPLP